MLCFKIFDFRIMSHVCKSKGSMQYASMQIEVNKTKIIYDIQNGRKGKLENNLEYVKNSFT